MTKTAFFTSKSHYLPQISRLFSVRPILWIFSGLMVGILASLWLWNPLLVRTMLTHPFPFALQKDTASVLRSYTQWKQVVENKPEYRDGYVMLAWYAQELGKTEEAQDYLQKAKILDPNYKIPEVLLLEKSLDSAQDK